MLNTSGIIVGSRAIQCVAVSGNGALKTGKKVFSYQGASNTVTDAQYALVSAGRAGTDGILNGITLAGGQEITVNDVDAAGNASGVLYAGPFGNWSQPANVGPGAFTKNLGAPIAAGTTDLLASTAITALPATLVKTDVARALVFTGNASSTSVLGVSGYDTESEEVTENITLNGTTAVRTLNAYAPSSAVIVSLVTAHTGDTFSVGSSATLGIGVRLDNRGAVAKGAVTFGGVVEATEPTIVVNTSVLALNVITTNSAPDGSHVIEINGIQSDSPLPSLLP